MLEIEVAPAPLTRLAAILSPARMEQLEASAARAREAFGDRVVWHVNATAHGGGVAEMLQNLLAYGKGAQIENRWLVLDGDPEFFAITKRLHNRLHGTPGDDGALSSSEHAHYEAVLRPNLEELLGLVSSHDIVLLHDPQTAGLIEGLRTKGATVVWRCHVGRDDPNNLTDEAWAFLRGYLDRADAFVFSRRAYAPPWIDEGRLAVIPPSIDPFSAKNVELTPDTVRAILLAVGLVAGEDDGTPVRFERRDGLTGTVRCHRKTGGIVLDGGGPPPDARLVVQVSRWDRLKDMPGVLAGFVRMITDEDDEDAHLVLVGPDVSGVTDDPEGAAVLADCRERWRALPDDIRERVHLASIPMDDGDENAVIVNAVQRHAAVVVQKSLVEGFGLTVAEAMWKGRPVVASRVGGIQDQIVDGRDGLLVDDPSDLDSFARVLGQVLTDHSLAEHLGRAAHDRVLDEFVGDRHLSRYVALFERLVRLDQRR